MKGQGEAAMAVLVIMESLGDPDRLLAAADELVRGAGMPGGLLARIVARTDDGILLVHLWESAEARSAWHEDPVHREAIVASGMPALVRERRVREHEADLVAIASGSPASSGRGAAASA
jgi:hypothetical protein